MVVQGPGEPVKQPGDDVNYQLLLLGVRSKRGGAPGETPVSVPVAQAWRARGLLLG